MRARMTHQQLEQLEVGSTRVQFRGRAFEAYDAALEIWLLLLIEEIDGVHARPGWLNVARDEWYLQATAEFGFGVMLNLDTILSEDSRMPLMLALCSRVLERMGSFGPSMNRSKLNEIVGRDAFTCDVPINVFLGTSKSLLRLLHGGHVVDFPVE